MKEILLIYIHEPLLPLSRNPFWHSRSLLRQRNERVIVLSIAGFFIICYCSHFITAANITVCLIAKCGFLMLRKQTQTMQYTHLYDDTADTGYTLCLLVTRWLVWSCPAPPKDWLKRIVRFLNSLLTRKATGPAISPSLSPSLFLPSCGVLPLATLPDCL